MSTSRRILIDARPINHPTARQRGIGRYTAGLIHGLSLAGADVVAASSSEEERDIVRDSIPGVDVRVWRPELVRQAAESDAWFVATQLMLHPITLDPVPDAVTRARLPVAAVMYDVIPERYPDRYLSVPRARQLSTVRSMLARTLDGILAISEFAARTSQEMLDLDPRKVISIGAGVGEVFTPSARDPWPSLSRLQAMGVDRRRSLVIAVTGGDDRKNTEGLIRAWALLANGARSSSQLVVACAIGPVVMGRWVGLAEDLGLAVGRDVVFTDAVSDDEILGLHRAAKLAVFPSLEEGFGLPVAEAAACGCPVICSDTSSLPEVIGSAEALFDPYDVMAITRAIEWGLEDEEHRARLLEAAATARSTWTWKRTGERAMAALDEFATMVDDRRRRPIARKIALVAPSSESPSAIGHYSNRVLRAWRHHSSDDVESFVDESGTDLRPASPESLCSQIGPYRHPYEFDHIVSVLGSSGFHLTTALMAEKFATHVWLHEASLAACYLHSAVKASSVDWARGFIASKSGGDFYSLEPEDFHERGITFLEPVLRHARSVIVSSHEAALAVQRVRAAAPPILVLPLAYPSAPGVEGLPPRRIVSVGWIAPNKRPEVLVHVADRAEVDVMFVGPALGSTDDDLRELAHRLGVSHRVKFTGRLPDDDFHSAISSARVGVQLRTGALGQRSAAIQDLIARGIPVVSNLFDADEISEAAIAVSVEHLTDIEAADELIARMGDILNNEKAWRSASDTARRVSAAWTFHDVVTTLDRWLELAEGFAPGSIVSARSIHA